MRHSDKFPPNAFLAKTLFKTPGRFLTFLVSLIVILVAGSKWFPVQTMDGILILIFTILPTAVILMIWEVVWIIRNPAPPPKTCQSCGHTLYDYDDNGQPIKEKVIDARYSYRTYAGIYAGRPSAAVMMAGAQSQAEKLWGQRATLVIQPVLIDDRLPTYTHLVWLSDKPMLKEYHGSELVIIWWSEDVPNVDDILLNVDWSQHAQDWFF